MLGALIAIGVLLVAIGFWGLLQPNALQHMVVSMNPLARYGLAVGVRVLLGLFLLLVAPEARWPGPTRGLGLFTLVAGVAILALGPSRLGRVVAWWSGRPLSAFRFASSAAIAIGVVLVVDGL